MPLIKRLLPAEELQDLSLEDQARSAEQLFSAKLQHRTNALSTLRRKAAAACSAKLTPMSALLPPPSGTMQTQRNGIASNATMDCSLEASVQIAASLALERKSVLFLVMDSVLVSKLLVIAMASQHPDYRAHAHEIKSALAHEQLALAFAEPLQRIQFRPAPTITSLLHISNSIERSWQETRDGYSLIVLPPLSELLAPYLSGTTGLTTAGNVPMLGLLACALLLTHTPHLDRRGNAAHAPTGVQACVCDMPLAHLPAPSSAAGSSVIIIIGPHGSVAGDRVINSMEKDDGAFDLFGSSMRSLAIADPGESAVQAVPAAPESPCELFPLAPGATATSNGTASALQDEELIKPKAPLQKTEDGTEFLLFPSADGSGAADEWVAVPREVVPAAAAIAAPMYPPSYKSAGNAVDIIAVHNDDMDYFTTPWHVAFSYSRFRFSPSTSVGDKVRIFINGQELPTHMQLLDRGRCVFATGGLSPPVTDLKHIKLHEDRVNHVRFEHFQRSSDTVRYVESRLHVWGSNDSIVVADLDGTLTVSDVEGHIRTLRLGQYDFLHSGACDFFTKLHELEMRIVYLTARPIDWASASRTHLENATQHAHSLPPGALITNSNGLTGALWTEVVNKNPHVFKAQVMNEIQLTMIHAGRTCEHPVFVSGFGNRPTDVVAYEQVGMDPSLIFMIDPYSNLKASNDPRIYESYADPNALLWLLPRLKHHVPLEKVQRIDDYTVRELVLAEDREQLLMAERMARRLQEEEYAKARQTSGSGPAIYGSYSM